MQIEEMSQEQCRQLLGRAGIGRLGCALDNQPYVLPVYFAYEADRVYVLATVGQKIEWLRANPKVCMEIDEIKNGDEWESVVLTGRYLELPESLYADEHAHARKLLGKRHEWWLNALAERRITSDDLSILPLFFRIDIESMTGLCARPDSGKKR